MSWKCALCGKTVYFAERKQSEGKDWHNICFNKYYKEKREKESSTLYGNYGSNTKRASSSSAKTKKCPDCDAEVENGTRFCSSCGYKFE